MLQHFSSRLLIALTLLMGIGPTLASLLDESTPGALRTATDDGRVVAMPLTRTTVTVEVSGFVARTTVEQRFANPFDRPIEAVYTFPLGEQAAVNDFAMQIGERVIRGEIQRKEEARRTYEAAREQGLQAALLDQQRPNVFTQSIANLEPGFDIVVRLRTVERLDYEAGTYQYTFPLAIGDRFGQDAPAGPIASDEPATATRAGHDVTIDVSIDAGIPLVGMGSPSHRIEVVRDGANRVRIGLAADDRIPNKDFVLRWEVHSLDPVVGMLAHRSGVDGYFSLQVQPRGTVDIEEATPKEIVLVLDTSGSMSGDPLVLSRAFARETLRSLGSRDRFNLIRFASGSSTFSRRSRAGDPEVIDEAVEWIDRLEEGGGTRMLAGLRAAIDSEGDPGRIRQLVFLTDGYIGNEDEILSRVRKLPDDVRIFTVGIGSSVNHSLLRQMAELGGGAYTFVPQGRDMRSALDRFRSWVTRPYLTDLQVDWGGLPIGDLVPEVARDLFSGQNISLLGRYYGAGGGTITVHGRLAGVPWEQQVEVELPEYEERHEALSAIWARQRIHELSHEELDADLDDNEIREEITELALEHRLISAYTSFVAVEYNTIVERPAGPLPVVRQATPRPKSPLETATEFLPVSQRPGEMAERVTVIASSDLIRLEQTASTTRFSDEFVQDLPVPGRFYQNVLTLAPGVEDPDGDGVPNVHASRSREFRTEINGVSNVDPLTGQFMSLVNADSIEEMELITGGAGVEFGRAQGGFARIIQKQGTNQFEGSFDLTLRSSRIDSVVQGSGRQPDGDYFGVRPALQLTGPVIRDRLWFRVSSEWNDWDIPVDSLNRWSLSTSQGSTHDAQLTWQVSSRNKLSFQVASTNRTRDRIDVSSMIADGTATAVDRDVTDYRITWTVPKSPRLLIETHAFYRDLDHAQRPAVPGQTNACAPDPAAPFAAAECFDSSTGAITGTSRRDLDDRGNQWGLNSQATWYAGRVLGAQHEVKAGVEYEVTQMIRDLAVGPALYLGEGAGVMARLPIESPTRSFGDARHLSFYGEDQITPIQSVVVTVGVRIDGQRVGARRETGAVSPLELDDWSVSPFVGASWDPARNGKNKLFFSFRQYHDDLSPALPLVAFEPLTVDSLLLADRTIGASATVNRQAVDPAAGPGRKDEWVVGYERELWTETTLQVSWTTERLRGQLGHVYSQAPSETDARAIVIGNYFDGNRETIVISVDRRQYRYWELRSSYAWSRATGDSEPFNPLLGDERNLLPPTAGYDADDQRHRLQAAATYITPWGIRLGGSASWQSGLPWSSLLLDPGVDAGSGPGLRFVYESGLRNDRRGPSWWNFDVKISKELNAGRGVNLAISAELFNLLADDALQVYNERWGLGRSIDGSLDGSRRFGRELQLGLRIMY